MHPTLFVKHPDGSYTEFTQPRPDPTPIDTGAPPFMDLVVAVEQERDALRRQVAQLDQANVTLSGQNTELAEDAERAERYEAGLRGEIQKLQEVSEALVSENQHARVNLARREQEAVAAWHERDGLRREIDALRGELADVKARRNTLQRERDIFEDQAENLSQALQKQGARLAQTEAALAWIAEKSTSVITATYAQRVLARLPEAPPTP